MMWSNWLKLANGALLSYCLTKIAVSAMASELTDNCPRTTPRNCTRRIWQILHIARIVANTNTCYIHGDCSSIVSVWLRLSHSLATWTVISVKDVVVNLMYTHWAHLSRINVFEDSQEKMKERVKTNCVIITLQVSFLTLLKLCGNYGGVVSLRFTVNWRARKRLKSFDSLIRFTDSTC